MLQLTHGGIWSMGSSSWQPCPFPLLSIQCEEEVEMGRKLVPPLLLVTGLDLGTAAAAAAGAAAAVGGYTLLGMYRTYPGGPQLPECV